MVAEVFGYAEGVWALAATIGTGFAVSATAEAVDDWRRSARRTRVVACKNAIGQAGMLAAQALLAVIGWVGVTQPPTPVQVAPVLQTWVFYLSVPAIALILLVTSVWTRLLYWRLFDTAESDRWG